MWDRDRTTDYQGYIESVHELLAGNAAAQALFDVIGDAIVAAQNN